MRPELTANFLAAEEGPYNRSLFSTCRRFVLPRGGSYKFWFLGKGYEGEMPAPPDQLAPDPSDRDQRDQYIHKISEPETIWWVKVKNRQGQVGWTNQNEHFGNMDACG